MTSDDLRNALYTSLSYLSKEEQSQIEKATERVNPERECIEDMQLLYPHFVCRAALPAQVSHHRVNWHDDRECNEANESCDEDE